MVASNSGLVELVYTPNLAHDTVKNQFKVTSKLTNSKSKIYQPLPHPVHVFDPEELHPSNTLALEQTCVKLNAERFANRVLNFKLANEEAHALPGHTQVGNLNPSNSTLYRARKAKAKLELRYELMEIGIQLGTYNPLNIIRRRKKLGQPEKKGSEYWTVEPAELAVDLSWKHAYSQTEAENTKTINHKSDHHQHQNHNHNNHPHIHLLHHRNQSHNSHHHQHNHHHHHHKHNQHLKHHLYSDDGEKSQKHQQNSKTSQIKLLLKNEANKLDNKSNSPRHSFQSRLSGSVNEPHTPVPPSSPKATPSAPNLIIYKRRLISGETHAPSAPDLVSRKQNQQSNSDTADSLSTKYSDKSDEKLSSATSASSKIRICNPTPEQLKRFSEEIRQLEHLEVAALLLSLQTFTVTPCPRKSTDIAKTKLNAFKTQTEQLISTRIPNIRHSLGQSETQIVQSRHVLSEISSRIDSLIADSDQTMNRLSTSYNLELKHTSERIDALNRCAGKRKALIKIGYAVLEYTVLCLMWIAWFIVTTIFIFRSVGRYIIKTVKWIMWF